MVAADDERTPLLSGSSSASRAARAAAGDAESDVVKKNPDNPVNLSKAKVATILAANWVRH